MEVSAPFDIEVMGYKNNVLDDTEIAKLHSMIKFSSTGEKSDVILE